MKIFPPVSEMIWPRGRSAADILWSRRYPLLAVAGSLLAAFSWSGFQLVYKTAPNARSASAWTKGDEACTTLVLQNSVATAGKPPCTSSDLNDGTSIKTGLALVRGALPPRSGQLTATDRAIQPPVLQADALRTTVWDRDATGNQPTYGTEKPAIALSPRAK